MVGVQFVMSLALTGMAPILPLFLLDLGVAPGGPVEFWSGVLSSLNFLIAAIVSPLWGAAADRYGRRVMVLRSSAAITVFTCLMGLSQSLWQLLAIRALMGTFSGFAASAIALVATQMPGARLGYALGWLTTGQLVGALAGPLLGGAVADLTGSYRAVFFTTSAIAGVAVLSAWFGVRENFERPAPGARKSVWAGLRDVARAPGLLPLFVLLLMAQFGVRAVAPVITLFVQDLLVEPAGLATLAGFAFSITGLGDLVASPFLGKRSDVIGYRRVLLISLVGAACMSVPQAWVTTYGQFLALRFGVGLFVGGLVPTANALVGQLVPTSQRGMAYGLTASATFLGSFLGPLSGGSIAAVAGIRWVFVLTGALFLLNWLWVWWLVPRATVPAPP